MNSIWDFPDIVHRLEYGQAEQNRAVVSAIREALPASGAGSIPLGGGWAHPWPRLPSRN